MERITIFYKLSTSLAFHPSRGSRNCAGLDLKSLTDCNLLAHSRLMINTGVCFMFPPGYYGFVSGRSSLALTNGVTVFTGTVDRDYTGAICVLLINNTNESHEIRRGDKIAQITFLKCLEPNFVINFTNGQILDQSNAIVRESGGFGSTGN